MNSNLAHPQEKKRRRRIWWIFLVLTVFVALEFLFWGRPLSKQFTVRSGSAESPHAWTIERRAASGGSEAWHARDSSGSGTMDLFETPQGNFSRAGLESPPKRWLVICLDGVPLNVMQNLWDRGHFREFPRPTVVVSVYPSDSQAALTAALHADAPAGYEDLYFDRARNEIRGGWWVTLSGYHIPYIRSLDYDPPGWAKALPYLLPVKTYRADLGRLRKSFLKSHSSVFIAHISASDSMMHLFTAQQTEPYLIEFENLVRDLYFDTRGDLGVLIFSDHGNTQTQSHAIVLEPFLQSRGWNFTQRINGPRDIVVPTYGLIGFAAVYCQPESAAALARDLAQLEGVQLVAIRDPDGHAATIVSDAGVARLTWTQDGARYSYAPQQGDPLALAPGFDKLRAEGRPASDGSATDADLFAATWQSAYPDAAARIRDWATNHAQNTSNLMVSLKPGYFNGKGSFQRIVNFAGTHGALDAPSSLGFAMGTMPLPPAIRLADLIPKEFLAGRIGSSEKQK
jgi:hypothetical protein